MIRKEGITVWISHDFTAIGKFQNDTLSMRMILKTVAEISEKIVSHRSEKFFDGECCNVHYWLPFKNFIYCIKHDSKLHVSFQ